MTHPRTTSLSTETSSTPRPVNTLLSEAHRTQARANRYEAAHLIRARDDLKLHLESTDLTSQLSAALVAVADLRERLAVSLAEATPSHTEH